MLTNKNGITEIIDSDPDGLDIHDPRNQKKITRTRRPWVYKSDYDLLKDKYETVRLAAIIGWALAAFVITAIMLILYVW